MTPESPEVKAKNRRNLIIMSVMLFILVIGIICVLGAIGVKRENEQRAALNEPREPVVATTNTPKASASVAATSAAPASVDLRPGTYEVGTEIQPGIYSTTVTGLSCYWARLRSVDGGADSIIANDLATSGTMKMEVKATDKYIEFRGKCVWKKTG